MRTYKKIERKYTDNFLHKTTCDICQKEIKNKSSFDATKTIVEMESGQCYPEGGSGSKWQIDICPDCFQSRLIPFVESCGTTIEEGTWERGKWDRWMRLKWR